MCSIWSFDWCSAASADACSLTTAYTHTYTHTNTHTHTHARTHTHTHTHNTRVMCGTMSVCVYVCLGGQRDACVLPGTPVYTYEYVPCMDTHTHTCMESHIHSRTKHTYMCPDKHHLKKEKPKWCSKKKTPNGAHGQGQVR